MTQKRLALTPKPAKLPPVAEMTPAQVISEAARILRNMGGPEYDAGDSWELAERLEKLAEVNAATG